MAVKPLLKSRIKNIEGLLKEEEFMSKGGTEASSTPTKNRDHEEVRFVLRVPRWIVKMVDLKRKESTLKASRNSWLVKMLTESIKSDY